LKLMRSLKWRTGRSTILGASVLSIAILAGLLWSALTWFPDARRSSGDAAYEPPFDLLPGFDVSSGRNLICLISLPFCEPPIPKAVLFVEAADRNWKTFAGSVAWRSETRPPGRGQPVEQMVRAEIDVPDRNFGLSWTFRRNDDSTIPLSHIIEHSFKATQDALARSPPSGVAEVRGVLMKPHERTRGLALSARRIKVIEDLHWIALLDSNKAQNIDLIKNSGWLDIALVYNNGNRAILALEKAEAGERAFADTFKAWGE